MTHPDTSDLPPGIIEARVIAMSDAEGNLVTDPDQADRIEVEQVTEDGVIEHIIMTTDHQ